MSKSQRVTFRDIRGAYILLGECCAAGASPTGWLGHLHEGLAQLYGVSQTVAFCTKSADMPIGRAAPSPGDRAFSFGWPIQETADLFRQFNETHAVRGDPCLPTWTAIRSPVACRSRQQLVDERTWDRSEVVNTYYRAGGIDQMMTSRCPMPDGRTLLLQLWRVRGERPFSEKEVRIVGMLHREIRRLYGRYLAVTDTPGLEMLSPRMLQVLELLCEGLSEKQSANRLGLSHHTVHDHVKRLHSCLGVSSRAELLKRVYELREHERPGQVVLVVG